MSNGSEHLPEFEQCGRGVCAANAGHEGTCAEASGWVEETPTDLVEEAREFVAHADQVWARSLVSALANAIESLHAEVVKHRQDLVDWESVGAPAWVADREKQLRELRAENEKLREERDYAKDCLRASLHNEILHGRQLDSACRERDALQAQRDSMSVVKRRTRVPATGTDGMILKLLDEQRLVGPWTVVPEDTK